MKQLSLRCLSLLGRLGLAALFAVAVPVLSASLVRAASPQYKIATVSWIGWSPLHVAETKHFWTDQGLTVQVRSYDNPIVILDAIKAGRADFAMDMAGTLAGLYKSGLPVVALAETNWSNGGDKIIIRKGKKPRDFIGQPLGVFLKQPSTLYFLNLFLQTQGLGLKDFRIVEVNAADLSAQFLAGRLPIILNYDPWAGTALQGGQGDVLATSREFTGCIPECIWSYRNRIKDIPPEEIEQILRGWVRAVAWIQHPKNWQEYLQILKTKTFAASPLPTDEDLKRQYEHVRLLNVAELRDCNRDGGQLEKYFLSLNEFGREAGLWSTPFQPRDVFDNRCIMNVLDDPQITTIISGQEH